MRGIKLKHNMVLPIQNGVIRYITLCNGYDISRDVVSVSTSRETHFIRLGLLKMWEALDLKSNVSILDINVSFTSGPTNAFHIVFLDIKLRSRLSDLFNLPNFSHMVKLFWRVNRQKKIPWLFQVFQVIFTNFPGLFLAFISMLLVMSVPHTVE